MMMEKTRQVEDNEDSDNLSTWSFPTRLTWNLAEGSIRTQKMMIIPRPRVRCCWVCPERMKRRDAYVLKKDLESCVAESCAAGAICMKSADTVFVTMQSREYRERPSERSKLIESQAAERVADQDKIRRREKSSEAPVAEKLQETLGEVKTLGEVSAV